MEKTTKQKILENMIVGSAIVIMASAVITPIYLAPKPKYYAGKNPSTNNYETSAYSNSYSTTHLQNRIIK